MIYEFINFKSAAELIYLALTALLTAAFVVVSKSISIAECMLNALC